MTDVKMYEVGIAVVDGEDVAVTVLPNPAVSPYKNESLAIRRAQSIQERNRRSPNGVKYIPVFDIVGPSGLLGRVDHNGEFQEA